MSAGPTPASGQNANAGQATTPASGQNANAGQATTPASGQNGSAGQADPRASSGAAPAPSAASANGTANQADAGAGQPTPEFLQFSQRADALKLQIPADAAIKKQQLQTDAEQTKSTIAPLVEEEATRLAKTYDQTIEQVRQSAANAITVINSNKDSKVEATKATATTELARFDTIVKEKQEAVHKVAEDKAQAAIAFGEQEAKRAADSSRERATRAETIKTEKVAKLAELKDSGQAVRDVESRCAALVQRFNQAGQDLAASARRKANDIATHIRGEADQVASRMTNGGADDKKEITDARDGAVKAIEQTAQDTVNKLNATSGSTIEDLKNEKEARLTQVRANAPAMAQAVDDGVVRAGEKIDSETARVLAEVADFVGQVTKVSWSGPHLQGVDADLAKAVEDHNAEMDRLVGDATKGQQRGIADARASLANEITRQAEVVTKVGTEFEAKTVELSQSVVDEMEKTRAEANTAMAAVPNKVGEKLQRAIDRAGEDWDRQIKTAQNDIQKDTDDALRAQDVALAELQSGLDKIGAQASSTLSSIGQAIGNFFSFLGGVIVGMFTHLWDMLGDIWELIKKPLFWAVVIILAIVLIAAVIYFGGAAVLGALGAIAKVLLVIGIVIGVLAAIYYIYKAITAPDLSPYERGKLVGAAIDEVILAFIGTGVLARVGSWVSKFTVIARILEEVGSIVKAARLLRRIRDLDKVALLLSKAEELAVDIDKLIELFDAVKDFDTLIVLLNEGKTLGLAVDDLIRLVKASKGVDELLALLAKAKALGVSGKKLVDLFDMVKDVDKLIQLLDQVKSAEKLEQLLLRVKKDADLLIELMKRSKDADELASLLAKVDDERKLLKLLDALEPADRPFLSQLLDTEKDVDKILQRLEEAKQARTSGVPIGIDPAKFAAASQRAAEMLRGMGYTFEEIVCEGSRVRGFSLEKGAGGALEPLLKPMDATRDLDMAVRVSASEFERVWQASFGRASAGSALEETGRHAREVGKITAGAARPRISSVRDAIVAMLGIEKGDLSIVRSGSSFGGGTVIPMK